MSTLVQCNKYYYAVIPIQVNPVILVLLVLLCQVCFLFSLDFGINLSTFRWFVAVSSGLRIG